MKQAFRLLILVPCLAIFSVSATNSEKVPAAPGAATYPISKPERVWVDSVYNTMSKNERLGQLIMLRAHSDKGAVYEEDVARLIRTYKVGGLCFFQGTPEKQATLTNYYQSLSGKLPLMISMDAEWGLGMRLKETTISFPYQMMLGAIQNNNLIYDMGKEIARQFRRIGMHINFAPSIDVNNNPNNPVINFRSFGENRYNVTAKGIMYMRGLQENGVMACAKHFPGHGDTNVDSHEELPLLPQSRERLDSLELFPFRVISQFGVQSMMIAHMAVPALDATANLPTSLSPKAVTDLLRNDIGYQGLLFTDGLEMKGVTKYYKNGEVEARALAAGNDVLLLPESVPNALAKIQEYVNDKKLDTVQIERSVKRVLLAKYRLGLRGPQAPIDLNNLSADLNSPEAIGLKRKLISEGLTTVRNESSLIPLKELQGKKIATLAVGNPVRTIFQSALDRYAKMEHYNIGKNSTAAENENLYNILSSKDVVIVSIHDMSQKAKNNFGLSQNEIDLINNLAVRQKNVILTVFGNPYSLRYFDTVDNVLECYDEDIHTQDLAAQAIMGVIPTKGKLPITASPRSKFGCGDMTMSTGRMGYDIPETVGMASVTLNRIDTVVQRLIDVKAAPGCVVLVAKDGKIIFNKAYGYQTYDKLQATTTDDIFDLASVTKVAATTMSMMKLQSEDKINVKQTLGANLPLVLGSNKETIVIEDIMAHQAGLLPWLKFYEATLAKDDTGKPCPSPEFYRNDMSADFPIPVANRLFLKKGYDEEVYKQIINSELRANREYKYSDLGMYLLARTIKEKTGSTIDEYVQKNLYEPMGLSTLTYNPLQKFPLYRIAPTEVDNYFRRTTVQGTVHDMGAAMLGGVSGHAGLFGSARDLATLFQMVLNGGSYAGQRYINEDVIKYFTTRYRTSTRRGVGFDMKELDPSKTATVSQYASANTFGHTGFTGTCVWADPDKKLVYVFLSNRTFPNMENNKLNSMDFRIKIQDIIYQALQ